MTYEEHLDEVATLLFERFNLSEHAAIQLVMKAQADGYFSDHDDDPAICTQLRAEQDAKRVFKLYGKPAVQPEGSNAGGPVPSRYKRR
ncbi:hypothetical protein [Zoogloea sp.]|uniref:hypothetical protein n=1 Tax=Zoogloea sp. TaxID=49181 RepID=UPI00262CCEB0|nr:hypothetical protein [Zoogloea sp.]MDD3352573.1 hypothetical protein [Zoogloea sp.]